MEWVVEFFFSGIKEDASLMEIWISSGGKSFVCR